MLGALMGIERVFPQYTYFNVWDLPLSVFRGHAAVAAAVIAAGSKKG